MERFGYKVVFEELNGNGIHRLENILTLSRDVHTFFDTLQLWLEPVEGVSNSPSRINCASTGFPGRTQHLQSLCGS